ncbi:MAG: glycoside hydrolase family 97 N-terminal domain-containing protein, partial [bacterium]|nr:glycoside hydrolase family 97 N-terminal domain-containing protein [bacterium]
MSDFRRALLIAALLASASGADALAGEQILTSPNQALSITLSDTGGEARYGVTYKGKALLKPSALGLLLDKGGALSRGLTITGSAAASVDQTYELVVGKTRIARDH